MSLNGDDLLVAEQSTMANLVRDVKTLLGAKQIKRAMNESTKVQSLAAIVNKQTQILVFAQCIVGSFSML